MKRIVRIIPLLAVLALVLPLLTACGATVKYFNITIQPSETGYLLPATQTNGQAQFNSEQYLKDKQVAAKQVQITYSRYSKSNAPFDYAWKNDSMLILVDRTPQTREWTDDTDTGTENKKQGLRLETKEAIDFSLGATCTGNVREEDAAKFLYYFGGSSLQGVQSDAEKADPDHLPISVYRSTSVASVMDNNVRGALLAKLFVRFHDMSLDDARTQAATQLSAAIDEVVKEFGDKGLTLTNCGGQGGMTFSDPNVQKAINDRFVAQQQAQAQKDKATADEQAADARYQAQVAENKRLLEEAQGKAAADKAAKQPEIDFYTALIKLCHDNPGIDCSQIIAATKYQGGVPQYAPYPQYPALPAPSTTPAPSPTPTPSH